MFGTNDQPWFESHVGEPITTSRHYLIFGGTTGPKKVIRIYHEAEKRYNHRLKTELQDVTQDHLWWTKFRVIYFWVIYLNPYTMGGTPTYQ